MRNYNKIDYFKPISHLQKCHIFQTGIKYSILNLLHILKNSTFFQTGIKYSDFKPISHFSNRDKILKPISHFKNTTFCQIAIKYTAIF